MKNYTSVDDFNKAQRAKSKKMRERAALAWLWGTNPRTSKSGAPVVDCHRHTGARLGTQNPDVLTIENGRAEVIGLFCRVCGASVALADIDGVK